MSKQLEARISDVYIRYCGRSANWRISEKLTHRYGPIIREINNFYQKNRYCCLPQKIKFSKHYKRRDINRIFDEIGGLKITRYTNEYGKTIVHFNFEDVSNSQ